MVCPACSSTLVSLGLLAGFMISSAAAHASDCLPEEPDSVQISWSSPCHDGSWLLDTELGCRMWDWHPAPEDTATWNGACTGGVKTGRGVMQWFEHGRPIDRFEGTFVAGRREGRGRYDWNETDWYDGFYEKNLPHGPGTAHIAGETFAGQWRGGCLTQGEKVVAIGVIRSSCEKHGQRVAAAFAGNAMVYRTDDVTFVSDPYHAFISDPRAMLGNEMANWLNRGDRTGDYRFAFAWAAAFMAGRTILLLALPRARATTGPA